MGLFAIMVAGAGLSAQEITITLNPGWNWISYPQAVAMEIGEALGDFVPMEGDIFKSQTNMTSYHNGSWSGGLTQFTPGWGYMYYSARTEGVEFAFAYAGGSNVVVTTSGPTDITPTRAVVGSTVTLPEGNHIFARGVCWGTNPNPDIDGRHASSEAVAGSQSIQIGGMNPGITYYVRAYAVTDHGLAYGNQQSFTTESLEIGYVDLGLPSGLLWATCNVGAEFPEDYGDYFSWGETLPKEYYDWDTYQYCMGNDETFTKYCFDSYFGYNGFIDNLTTLLPEDDAATANWGSDWRMPTKEEWVELYQYTTRTWTTQNGVNGQLFTAANGNSIFLPAAGCRLGSDLSWAGSYGKYWSRSLDELSSDADYIGFFSDGCYIEYDYRKDGYSVRPVRSGGHDYVDLGLPSGTIWATCNVGADTPEAYGDHFAWGETQPKDDYDWYTYQYSIGYDHELTKYCTNSSLGYNGFTDNLTTLLPEDDAATANWGGDWRMPTKEEWQELLNNTTHTWTTRNGVNGYLFTATNGNNLFLPAAGYRSGDDSNPLSAGIDGFYSSSSLYNWSIYAWHLYFNSDEYYMADEVERSEGHSVRPVRHTCHITVTAHPNNGGTVTGEGSFLIGRSCTVTATPNEGYTFVNWTENGAVVSTGATYTFTVEGGRNLVANFSFNTPTGAIDGKFTINADGDQVYFSQGNLQYKASTNTWRFATNQYDYVGSNNSNISSTYSGWIDLFGWGTSGYNHGAVCYQPWSTSQTDSDYYAYGSATYNLNDRTGMADWGYNAISNGGNQTHQWRTLTTEEWYYVFNTRETTSGKRYAKANVNNVKGMILLPDDWSTGTYSLSYTNSSNASFSSNILTAAQWSILEQAGAVFLPAAGGRDGTSVSDVGSGGIYWSASNRYSCACYVYFNDFNLYTSNFNSRYFGRSVRLVRDAE